MGADAQCDGHPAEYKWRHLRKLCNYIPCTKLQSLADAHWSNACSNAANIGERKTWTQSEVCTWQTSGAKARGTVFLKKTAPFVISSYLCFGSYKLRENFQKYIVGVACCEYGINYSLLISL